MNEYSVALCTYNGEKYIEEQLRSILEQSIVPREIIISDDGSTDDTLLIADHLLKESGINYKIVSNQNSHGVANNFLYAISLCNSDIVFTSDQDDVWVKEKAKIILDIFNTNKKALLVFSDGELVNKNLKPLNCNMWKSVDLTAKMVKEGEWFSYLLNRCLVTGAAMAFRRILINDNEIIPSSWLHDGWLAWKAVARDGLVACPEKLILYRQHGGNVVGMKGKNIITRAISYFSHFDDSSGGRNIRYSRYVDLKNYMGSCFTKDQQDELDKCIGFWHDMSELKENKSKLKQMRSILSNWIKGNFSKYSSGNRGAFRILIVTLFQ